MLYSNYCHNTYENKTKTFTLCWLTSFLFTTSLLGCDKELFPSEVVASKCKTSLFYSSRLAKMTVAYTLSSHFGSAHLQCQAFCNSAQCPPLIVFFLLLSQSYLCLCAYLIIMLMFLNGKWKISLECSCFPLSSVVLEFVLSVRPWHIHHLFILIDRWDKYLMFWVSLYSTHNLSLHFECKQASPM